MMISESCQNTGLRRNKIREHINKKKQPDLNGIDYIEVEENRTTRQTILTVHLLDKAPSPEHLGPKNVRIDGGRRITGFKVLRVEQCAPKDRDTADCIKIILDKWGDFSTYTLRLVEADGKRPLEGFDPRYARIDFTFKIDCPSDLDCQPLPCPPAVLPEPEINYLAKDYGSFRQLILDRLALLMPDWTERHAPDLGIALIEILAYTGDYLSYYQDAVATEAYLGTARQRISVRRHARLVDYTLHEGCNARAWLFLETSQDIIDQPLDPQDMYFITGYNTLLPTQNRILSPEVLRDVPPDAYEVFEPVRTRPIKLRKFHNTISFYTWGDRECCLPKGATGAYLKDSWLEPTPSLPPNPDPTQQTPPGKTAPGKTAPAYQTQEKQAQPYDKGEPGQKPEQPKRKRALKLRVGDFLLIEEVLGPKTGNPADADPSHRQVVRLTRVRRGVDKLYDQPYLEVEWALEDALTFPVCLSGIGPAPECKYLEDISVARGNIILVDHGQRVSEDLPGSVPEIEAPGRCEHEGCAAEPESVPGKFRPYLTNQPLTFRQRLKRRIPARQVLLQDPRLALPQIKQLRGWRVVEGKRVSGRWIPRPDLLASGPDDRHYVVEVDNQGVAHLRFGDGELGHLPEAGTSFSALYRVGNGPAGNVGAEAISHVLFRQTVLSGIELRPRNPLPAQGGTAPEPMEEAKLFAPGAFRKDLQRAITAEDYARLAERNPKIQRAAANLVWTGSGYEVQVAIDPVGSEVARPALLDEIEHYLYSYRRIGHDLVVMQAQYVPLEVAIQVCVQPHYLRGHVKQALLDVFSNRTLAGGKQGFFHPDNLTFGEGIYLSQLIAAAQAVPGVESVQVTKLERYFQGPNHALEDGVLPLGPLEIARLDNDPNFPENGKLTLDVRGGR